MGGCLIKCASQHDIKMIKVPDSPHAYSASTTYHTNDIILNTLNTFKKHTPVYMCLACVITIPLLLPSSIAHFKHLFISMVLCVRCVCIGSIPRHTTEPTVKNTVILLNPSTPGMCHTVFHNIVLCRGIKYSWQQRSLTTWPRMGQVVCVCVVVVVVVAVVAVVVVVVGGWVITDTYIRLRGVIL